MPYKNKNVEREYKRLWAKKNKENIYWAHTLWREQNNERKNELDRQSWTRHKDFYNCINRLKRKLEGAEIQNGTF